MFIIYLVDENATGKSKYKQMNNGSYVFYGTKEIYLTDQL